MNQVVKSTLVATGLFGMLIGCESTGLSHREVGRQNYSGYLFAMYPDSATESDAPARRPVYPIKVAVAQVGEVTPPIAFIDRLRQEKQLFARVEGIPGMTSAPDPNMYHVRDRDSEYSNRQQANDEMSRMRRVASDMGMDYLLICGGTIDHDQAENGLGLLDLTVVGAFVVPSKQLGGVARASGALIDAKQGGVVLISSAEAEKSRLSSSVTQHGNRTRLIESLREEALSNLADQVVADAELNRVAMDAE